MGSHQIVAYKAFILMLLFSVTTITEQLKRQI